MKRLLAAILVLAFTALGSKGLIELRLLPLLKPDVHALRDGLQPNATSDDYLRQLLSDEGVPSSTLSRPSAAIRDAVSGLPSSDPILFIAPRNTPANQLAYLVIKGLSLPHLLQYAWCEPPDAPRRSDKLAAVLLYNLPQPAEYLTASSVIPRLTMIPGAQAQQWTAYCSR
jgi:hypothetical protein